MPSFKVIIVGAGTAGLSTAIALRLKGHSVTVLERHPNCQALGGPVGLAANATRVLTAYGLEKTFAARDGDTYRLMKLVRYVDGTLISVNTSEQTKVAFGYPSWSFSRYGLQKTLAEAAVEKGAEVRWGCKVMGVEELGSGPAVRLEDGTVLEADLVVGADGFRSVIRDAVVGEKVQSTSPFSAYNIDLPRELLRKDPDLEPMLTEANFWLGPGRIVVALNMPDLGDKLNLCLVSEEPEGKEGEWYTLGDLAKVKAKFADFEPRVQKLLNLADPNDTYIWRLSEVPSLKQWVSESGKIVAIGDGAHAMLPYVGMGAGMCIEDSACFAECLDRAASASDIPTLMRAFETLRRPRTDYMVKTGRFNAKMWHLSDGKEQQERDTIFGRVDKLLPEDNKPWSGGNVDDPPAEPFGPRVAAYKNGYDVFDHVSERIIE